MKKTDVNKWSYFTDNYRELHITDQETPYPWENYIYDRSGLFYTLVGQNGRGKTFYNYEENHVGDGRDYFLSDGVDVWSMSCNQAPVKAKKSLCRMLPGRSIFEVAHNKVSSSLTVTIDPDSTTEVNKLVLVNKDKTAKTLDLTAVMHTKIIGKDNSQQLDASYFDKDSNSVIFRRYHSECVANKYASFFTATYPASSWCGSEMDFVGGVRPFERSAVLFEKELNNCPACALGDPLMAMRFHVTLQAGEKVTIYLANGIVDSEEDAVASAKIWNSEKKIISALNANDRYYKKLLAGGTIKTPDDRINAALNIWTRLQLTHQNLSGRNGQHYNWRNNLQDAMGFMHINTEYLRSRLVGMAECTKKDGFVPRITGKTPMAPHSTGYDLRHNDIGCWYAIAAGYYVRETGDIKVLDEVIYNKDRKKEITVGKAIFDGLMWTLSNRGINGLVRFVDGDWSDPLEKAGRNGIGESVWTSMAVIKACKEFAPLLEMIGRKADAERVLKGAVDVEKSVAENAWDGAWYVRGITDDGVKFCTASDPDANVSMLVQAWAVLAEADTLERRNSAMKAVAEHCITEYGPMLYGPPFMVERDGIGRESAKRPGCCENGSCYTHGSMMLCAALIKHGEIDEAYRILKMMMFPMAAEVYETRKGIPLWWSNYLQAPVAAYPGRSSNIISSGAPAWFFLNILEGFCGIKPEINGLTIDPAFPAAWDKVELERKWRDAVYDIKITRKGKYSLKLDGKVVKGKTLPVPEKNSRHIVEVEF